MAGGRPEDIEAVRPLMADVAQRFTVMGPPGAGLAAKMINQMIVGCTHAVLAEALIVAEASGIDAARIPECLAGGHADGPLLQRNYPRMAARDFAPQGYARQLLKDLEMVGAFAGALKAPTPMSGQALNLYRLLAHLGHGELDTTAIVKVYDGQAADKEAH
jgi:3-hydroxyisobutyrate dehydrogenase-like beta-hydroxyacid dehydrogenase